MDPPQQTCQSKNRYHEVVRKDAVLYVCMYVCMYVCILYFDLARNSPIQEYTV